MPEVYVVLFSYVSGESYAQYKNGTATLEALERLKMAGYPYRFVFLEDVGFRQGIIKPLNTILRMALADTDCQFIHMQSNDHHCITPNWLKIMVETLKSNPTIGCLSPMQFNDHGHCMTDWEIGYSNLGLKGINDPYWDTFAEDYVDISRGFCTVRAEMLRKIGLFDENFGTGAFENYDMWNRANNAGYRSHIFGKVKYTHCVHGNQIHVKSRDIEAGTHQNVEKWWDSYDLGPYYVSKWGEGPGNHHGRKPAFEGAVW